MKARIKFILLAMLTLMVLLTPAGCEKAQPVDASRYNAADGDKFSD